MGQAEEDASLLSRTRLPFGTRSGDEAARAVRIPQPATPTSAHPLLTSSYHSTSSQELCSLTLSGFRFSPLVWPEMSRTPPRATSARSRPASPNGAINLADRFANVSLASTDAGGGGGKGTYAAPDTYVAAQSHGVGGPACCGAVADTPCPLSTRSSFQLQRLLLSLETLVDLVRDGQWLCQAL